MLPNPAWKGFPAGQDHKEEMERTMKKRRIAALLLALALCLGLLPMTAMA